MTNGTFALLYAACLMLCIGMVQGMKLSGLLPDAEKPLEPQKVEQVVIAVPPRPEGVRPVEGEGEEGFRYTEQGCREQTPEYQGVCFQQLARQQAPTDIDGALRSCSLIADAELVQECQADVAELHAPTDKTRALAICPSIALPKWGDQCVFGIALALVKKEPEPSFRLCDQAGRWATFCRHDVNGEIAQFNSDLAMAHCAAEEGDLLTRKSCWHGIGKYVARVDVDRAFQLCETTPLGPQDLYRENCYHGLGWGASETAGKAFAAECARAGEKKDSCMLGVAYNLRRFDQEAGMDLCAQVHRQDLAEQCRKFVSFGRI
jgi:hypothetical protein